jgi:hypothetical protein
VIYTHTHGDHFGGVLGFTTREDVAAGKVAIIAPSADFERLALRGQRHRRERDDTPGPDLPTRASRPQALWSPCATVWAGACLKSAGFANLADAGFPPHGPAAEVKAAIRRYRSDSRAGALPLPPPRADTSDYEQMCTY